MEAEDHRKMKVSFLCTIAPVAPQNEPEKQDRKRFLSRRSTITLCSKKFANEDVRKRRDVGKGKPAMKPYLRWKKRG